MQLRKIRKPGLLIMMALIVEGNIMGASQNNLKLKDEPVIHTVFNAGEDDVNTYRIPSLVVTNDSSILVFGEARRISWRDKSRTDIVMKKSSDNGETWSSMSDLTKGSTGAYMDPTPIVDKSTGTIFLFCNFWPEDDHSGKNNRSILITSSDNGTSWSEPMDVTESLLQPGQWSMGFGPGKGIQLSEGKYKGRLIMPMRLADSSTKKGYDITLFSDDGGKNWNQGTPSEANNEFMIAEAGKDTLIYNARHNDVRRVSRSYDGGVTWTPEVTDTILPVISRGCEASILGTGDKLYYCGIDGIPETSDFDERARMSLYRSNDGGKTWGESITLYEPASGYTCIDELPDGRLAIIFEDGDTPGFTRKSIPDTNPPQRPAGWMRLDLMIVNPEK